MGILRPTSALFAEETIGDYNVTDEYLAEEFMDVHDMEFDYEPTLEGAAAVIAYGQDTFNSIDQEFGMAQLEHFLLNKESMPITEGFGDKATGYLEKIKYWLKSLGNKIKKLFDKFFAMLSKYVMNDKDFIKKYESKIKDASTNGFKFQGYNFTLGDNVDTARGKLSKFEKTTLDTSIIDAHKDKTTIDIKDEMRGLVIGGSKVTASEFGKELFKKFRGKQDSKVDVTVDKASIISTIKTAKDDKAAANKAYNALKKVINDKISAIGTLEKALKKDDAGSDRGKKSQAASLIVEDMKAELEVLQYYNGAYLRAIKDRNRQCRAMAVKLMYGKTKESAEEFYGSASFNSNLFV